MDRDKQQKHLVEEAVRVLGDQYESNAAFNKYFDGNEPLSIPSPQGEVGQYQYERSKVLFWVDREAYEDERIAWDNKSILELHQDALMLIRNNGHAAPFRHLVDAVTRQRIVPFVGAGLSKPMNMPLWGEALKTLYRRLPNLNDPHCTTLIDSGRYLEAAQILADHDAVLTNNFIHTTYRVQSIAGPVVLLPRIAHGCIVTTNFDDAIEEVYKRSHVAFDGYMHGTQHHNFFTRLVRGERSILKLHGDVDDSQTYILTKTQYTQAYGESLEFQKPLPKALRQIFISNSLLFLGCSLEKDRTLDLFRRVKDQSEYEIPNHYALIPAPDSPAVKQQKESDLLALNIQPIWYPDSKHEFVEKLLRLVIDVAEKRIAFSG